MDRYCTTNNIGKISPGVFWESHFVTHCGNPFEDVDEFVELFVERIMQNYERPLPTDTLEIGAEFIEAPNRTRTYYRRLFSSGDPITPTQDFLTIASETLALWIEEYCDDVKCCEPGILHNSDPAFDVLSIIEENDKKLLRVTQVKATQKELQKNCSKALEKFKKLERGDYDAELQSALRALVLANPGLGITNLSDLRLEMRYRVTAAHGEDRSGIKILTKYNTTITGEDSRRSAVLIHVSWPRLWNMLAEKIYAQLS